MINSKISYEAANQFMDKIAQESQFTQTHKGYTKVPQKIHRCFGLSQYEKLILIDLVAYMSNKHKCYPTIETIARNVGCSSKSVERHLQMLHQKSFILISQSRKNNEYYLFNNLHVNPYLLISEKTHEFVNSVRHSLNERELTSWIRKITSGENYQTFINKLESLNKYRSRLDLNAEIEYLKELDMFLKGEFNKKFPNILNDVPIT